jgi:ABC-type multidrug transport system fused ATPase/permease subunit
MHYGRKMQALGKETQAALAEATEVADESLSHIRTVRSFARERLQVHKYAAKVERTFELGRQLV